MREYYDILSNLGLRYVYHFISNLSLQAEGDDLFVLMEN